MFASFGVGLHFVLCTWSKRVGLLVFCFVGGSPWSGCVLCWVCVYVVRLCHEINVVLMFFIWFIVVCALSQRTRFCSPHLVQRHVVANVMLRNDLPWSCKFFLRLCWCVDMLRWPEVCLGVLQELGFLLVVFLSF